MTDDITQDEGKVALGAMVGELVEKLGEVFPYLECAVVFWNHGEPDNRLGNVVYASPEVFPQALAAMETAIHATREASSGQELHGLDTPDRVCFYEQDFYVLSNFSAFSLTWRGKLFPTLEHAYHWEKFRQSGVIEWDVERAKAQREILAAPSAHEAFKLGQLYKAYRNPNWDLVKSGLMLHMIWAKTQQHEYVRRKLLATGSRELVENSWRDDYWGWGPNRDGQNMLGKLWMEVRGQLRASEDNPSFAAQAGYVDPDFRP